MNETRNQQEPSMEEILASIRRIISDDGQELQSDTGREASRQTETRAPSAADGKVEASQRQSSAGNGDVLVLTEMLAEDGTVISLATPSPALSAGDADLSKTPEAAGLPEPPEDSDPTTDLEPAKPMVADPLDKLDRIEPSIGRTGAEAPRQRNERAPSEREPAGGENQKMEGEAVSNEARKTLNLVSESTEMASTAAFAELARTVAQSKDVPVGGGRMVEDLVREALQPMLREWLDANLPALVERLVRSEIQRIVRRAEEDA